MGLLDELREKAEEQRTQSERLAALEAELADFYREELRPRMHQAYNFFQQLVEHLKEVNEECTADYALLPEDGQVTCLQSDYSIIIDSSEEPTQLELRCKAHLPEPIEFDIKGKAEVLRHSKLLDKFDMKYERTDSKDARFDLASARFKVIGPIPIRVAIKANLENKNLSVIFRNFDASGVKSARIVPSKFNDDFLDTLGRYVLRQPVNLFGGELSKEARRKLREKLELQREEEARERRALEAERAALEKFEYENRTSVKLARAVSSATDKLKSQLARLKTPGKSD